MKLAILIITIAILSLAFLMMWGDLIKFYIFKKNKDADSDKKKRLRIKRRKEREPDLENSYRERGEDRNETGF